MIIINAGMPKSGTTLTIQYQRDLIRCVSPRNGLEEVNKYSYKGYLDTIDDNIADTLRRVRDNYGPFVVKIHSHPTKAIKSLIDAGEARATFSFRDPRDTILSVLDHAKRTRNGLDPSGAFATLQTISDGISFARSSIETYFAWKAFGKALFIRYEDFMDDKIQVLEKMARFFNFKITDEELRTLYEKHEALKETAWNFNKGTTERCYHEMSYHELSLCDEAFGSELVRMGYKRVANQNDTDAEEAAMDDIKKKIWEPSGLLRPIEFASTPKKDLAIVLVNRNRRDLTDSLCQQIGSFNNTHNLSYDIFVVDIGSEPEERSPFTTIEYEDKDFRGKCYGHNVGIRQAALTADYRYYWVMMNDLLYDDQPDAMDIMIQLMDNHPELGILSPTSIEKGRDYPGSKPQKGQTFRKVPVCEYLSFMMRGEALKSVGFLNPNFRYSWGSIHELCYKLYRTGKWMVAYCDTVHYDHLGGTTYGQTKNVVSRAEYNENAKKFAAHYFIENYGHDWDKRFESALPPEVTLRDTYARHRAYWQDIFSPKEQLIMDKS